MNGGKDGISKNQQERIKGRERFIVSFTEVKNKKCGVIPTDFLQKRKYGMSKINKITDIREERTVCCERRKVLNLLLWCHTSEDLLSKYGIEYKKK